MASASAWSLALASISAAKISASVRASFGGSKSSGTS
eukprot:CAMPEP_0182536162 /NCGR_PEP_ID=MMETSP1323-20130603/19468_1 /TAXON_ID=236787 /ORGANISM="Florenciella parvula, Strain RCC1693" /LENGTH=36 /DNA_ID= /DNA_START= /DNA_END= /DNA_ORIENTATION=